MVKNPFQNRLHNLAPETINPIAPGEDSPAIGEADLGGVRAGKKSASWRWSLAWLTALAIFCGMGTSAFVWLVMLPPPVDCRQGSENPTDMERLYCAQEAARSGELQDLVAGIDTLSQWNSDHPLYGQSQDLIAEWSAQILEIARTKVKQNDLKGALAAVQRIPKTTSVYQDAQKSVTRWQKYAQQAAVIYAKAQTGLKQQKWDVVAEQIRALSDFEQSYWQLEKGSTALSQQLGVEKQARQTLAQARRIAASPNPSQLGAAIAMASQIPGGTYTAADASPLLKQWSQKLLTLANQKWQKGEPQGAVDLLSTVPATVKMPEVQDLVRFGQAYELALGGATSRWMPSITQIYRLMEAIGAIKQISANSPFYTQAQSLQKNWQTQLQDLSQLQFARMTADLGQHSTIQWAMRQANQVPTKNPRRYLSQTLVSYWDKESERLEDQPVLDRALAIAKPGDTRSLRSAIEQARLIQPGRSLRIEAQTRIAAWQDQIERIEDQPILDRAWLLAQNGDLNGAINEAKQVASGRVLYGEAQALVDRWQTELIVRAQIAADRPILDRARSLAAAGSLSEAINVAGQISRGRALYREAQGAIAEWSAERDRIWNERNREYTLPDPSDWTTEDNYQSEPFSPTESPAPENQWSPSPTPSPYDPVPQWSPSPAPAGELPEAIETVPPPEPFPDAIDPAPAPEPPPQAEPSPESSPYEGYYDERHNTLNN
ncbi:DUF3824 domain-containing protein [Leptolyngbya ohadii]|uniref:DUF3824 domain-containing protein n=1 Tax=Leptolyngbya ohadii TaxID=1962290 RepID=UPI000B59E5F3|nr:DUF3824 domain-containing protein [Leptolyngbya ohadii]